MLRIRVVIFVAIVLAVSFPVAAQGSRAAGGTAGTAVAAPTSTSEAPMPGMTIEGVSGGFFVPSAYLANPGPQGAVFGMPSIAANYFSLGSENLYMVGITDVLWRRIELGYAFNYLDISSMNDYVNKLGADMGRDNVMLHHFNVRGQVIEENSFGMSWMPAVTVGVHFKYNDGIRDINHHLLGGLELLGYDSRSGWDVTLTASKTFPTLAWGRPVTFTSGLRSSNAAQIGLFGFADERSITYEHSIVYMPTDKLALAYEFRMKDDPYDNGAPVYGMEHSWYALEATYLVSDRLTISGVFGSFGNIGNTQADPAVGFQVKYEF
jgi:hypothetical protein